jgi:hypothetical protein
MTEIVPGGLSLVKPGRGRPAKNNEAPDTFKNSLRVKLSLGIF